MSAPLKKEKLIEFEKRAKSLKTHAITLYKANDSGNISCHDELFEDLLKQYEAGMIREDLFNSLLDLEKYYRDKISAHITSEIATDEKARLFLSALLSLGKALFQDENKNLGGK
ncbi:MAG: hypothetical protein QW491_13835 [Thermoproteota archaeon]